MDKTDKTANWLLVITAVFALMELFVGSWMLVRPEAMADKVDLAAKGSKMVLSIWATRQIALGVILAYAAIKKIKQCFIWLICLCW